MWYEIHYTKQTIGGWYIDIVTIPLQSVYFKSQPNLNLLYRYISTRTQHYQIQLHPYITICPTMDRPLAIAHVLFCTQWYVGKIISLKCIVLNITISLKYLAVIKRILLGTCLYVHFNKVDIINESSLTRL